MPSFSRDREPVEQLFTEGFCSYCGYPPRRGWHQREGRVCVHCGLGVVLGAPPSAAPRPNDMFVIADPQLTVHAISRAAETVLGVHEPEAVGAGLAEFLVSEAEDPDHVQLAPLIARAMTGELLSEPVALRTVGGPEIALEARISSCGPPVAGLLILAPRAGAGRPRASGAPRAVSDRLGPGDGRDR